MKWLSHHPLYGGPLALAVSVGALAVWWGHDCAVWWGASWLYSKVGAYGCTVGALAVLVGVHWLYGGGIGCTTVGALAVWWGHWLYGGGIGCMVGVHWLYGGGIGCMVGALAVQ